MCDEMRRVDPHLENISSAPEGVRGGERERRYESLRRMRRGVSAITAGCVYRMGESVCEVEKARQLSVSSSLSERTMTSLGSSWIKRRFSLA
jgi:hypothetical protein